MRARIAWISRISLLLVFGFVGFEQQATADTITYPGSISTTVTNQNEAGSLIGEFRTAQTPDTPEGFLYNGTSFTLIDVPQGQRFGEPSQTRPTAINNLDQIVGRWAPFQDPVPSETQGFLYSNGTYTILPFLNAAGLHTGCSESAIVPLSIDDSGVVSGKIVLGGINSVDVNCQQRWQGILPSVDPDTDYEFVISFEWYDGNYYSDELPGVLTSRVPEPGTIGSTATGLVVLSLISMGGKLTSSIAFPKR